MDDFTCNWCGSTVSKVVDGVCEDCLERDAEDHWDDFASDKAFCHQCGGEGVDDAQDGYHEFIGDGTVKCPLCEGTGRLP